MTGRDSDLLGIPYADLNCWQLVTERLYALGYLADEVAHPEASVVAAATSGPTALDHLIPPNWLEIGTDDERIGDIVALGQAGGCTHFGVVDRPGWVLHTTALKGSHLSKMRDLRRAGCVHSVWRIRRC